MLIIAFLVVLCASSTFLVYKSQLRQEESLANFGLGLALGILIETVAAAILFHLNLFYDSNILTITGIFSIGLFGWGWFLGKSGPRLEREKPNGRQTLIVRLKQMVFSHWRLTVLIAFVLKAYLPPATVMVGGQDPSLYSGASAQLALTGKFDKVLTAHSILNDEPSFKKLVWENKTYKSDHNGTVTKIIEDKPALLYDFQRGPSYFMAVTMKALGLELGYSASAFVSLAGVLVFYVFMTPIASKNISFIAAFLVALNPAQIWFGKASYSEPPSLLFIWLALVSFSLYFKPLIRGNREYVKQRTIASNLPILFVCALSTASSFWMRQDQIIVVASIMFFFPLLLLVLKRENNLSVKKQDWFEIGIFYLLIVGFCYAFTVDYKIASHFFYSLVYEEYFFLNNIHLYLAGGAVFSLSMAALAWKVQPLQKLLKTLQKIIETQRFIEILSVLFIVLLVWGMMIRLVQEPWEYFGSDQNHNAGSRTMDEHIFIRIALMAGVTNLVLGFWGAFILLRDQKTRYFSYVLIFLWAAYCSVLLVSQNNSPMLFWASRRYIPIVVPGFIAFGTYFTFTKLPLLFPKKPALLLSLLFVINTAPMIYFGETLWHFREMYNSYKVVQGLDAAVSESKTKHVAIFADAKWRHFNHTFNFFSKHEVIAINKLPKKLSTHSNEFKKMFSILADKGIQPVIVFRKEEKDVSWQAFEGKIFRVEARFSRLEQTFNSWPRKRYQRDHSYQGKVIKVGA